MNVTSNDNLQETKQPVLEMHDRAVNSSLDSYKKIYGKSEQGNEQHYLWKYVTTEIEKPLFSNLTDDLYFTQNSLIHTMIDKAPAYFNIRITATPAQTLRPKKVFFNIPTGLCL